MIATNFKLQSSDAISELRAGKPLAFADHSSPAGTLLLDVSQEADRYERSVHQAFFTLSPF
jgi:hypothetical protein